MAKPHANLVRRYEQDLRLFGSRSSKAGLVAAVALWLLLPQLLIDPFWLTTLCYAGTAAIGAIGLNLLTGYTGQVSLGHAFFIGIGAYTAAQIGGAFNLPLPLWLGAAALMGALLGALIGPFALRLRGNYLAIVTLGLVFLGEHIFQNLEGITGGNSGTPVDAPVSLGFVDFEELTFLGQAYSREQGYFWLIWAIVAICALAAKNLVRTRPGRAMQAIRDRDVAAEVIGVQPGRYKIGVFALSSAMAAMGGALFGSLLQYVSLGQWNLFLSIQYIAIIIVGGVGTIFGAILGALFLQIAPRLTERYSDSIPGVSAGGGDDGFITVFALNQALFGVLIVLFLIFEPRGLAAIWLRFKAYLKAWPFRY